MLILNRFQKRLGLLSEAAFRIGQQSLKARVDVPMHTVVAYVMGVQAQEGTYD